MKVLMFGWEFPPYKSGGLGTACYDLTKGLSMINAKVTFVMPSAPENADAEFVNLIGANKYAKKVCKEIKIKKIKTILTPYMTSENYEEAYAKHTQNISINADGKATIDVYGSDMYTEVMRMSMIASHIAKYEDHDVIHAHDWMTYPAGLNAREISGKPLVVHIHATEFDRTGGNPNSFISHIEYEGMSKADLVIANSNFTKNNVIKHYNIDPNKIKVVHWGIDPDNPNYESNYKSKLNEADKIVLFLGRITIQKGPDYFIEAAAKVLNFMDNVKFVIAGSGDMMPKIIERAHELGISDKVIFTGFLRGADVHKAFQMADLYVMPSTSEPFGLVALESLKNNTPILISKQSGVSEVLHHALKVDFWDIDAMANKIIGALKYNELHHELKKNSYEESNSFNLVDPARKTLDIYKEAIERFGNNKTRAEGRGGNR